MARARVSPTVIAHRGDVIVERDPRRATGRLLRQGGMDASYVDLADPRRLEFDYLRWMRIVLRSIHARQVLHVGGGACALARALATEDPDGRQQVCEVDGTVLAVAREHLGLRRVRGLRVRQVEGRSFIARQPRESWDAVVIDAYIGAAIPRSLITVQALADIARVAPLVLVNVVDDRSARELRVVAAAVADAYPRAWALGGRTGNTVVAGERSQVAARLEGIAAHVASDREPARMIEPRALARMVAGTRPVRDEDLA